MALLGDNFALGGGDDVIAAMIGGLNLSPDEFEAAEEEFRRAIKECRELDIPNARYDGEYVTMLYWKDNDSFMVFKPLGMLWGDKGKLMGLASYK